jgi:predicted permease
MPDFEKWVREYLDLPEMTDHRDQRIAGELAAHLEEVYRDALSRGVTEEGAEALVLELLGERESAVRELLRSERLHAAAEARRRLERAEERLRRKGGGWAHLADLTRDLRVALRALAKRPLFTGLVILVLALGIGATTAIFTLVDAIILSPLPFDGPDRLVAVQHAAPGRGLRDVGQCAAWHFTYEDENRVFEDLGMFTGFSMASVTGAGDPEAVPTLQVTSGVFRAIQANPVLGRIFTPEDEDPDGPATVMLSRGYWQSRFGEDPNVLGQTLQVDGITREIIGVMPSRIRALGYDPALILPLRFRRSSLFVGNIGYDAVARLRGGVTLEEARADLTRVLPMAWEKFPGGPTASSNDPSHYQVEVRPLKDDLVGSVASLLWVLLGGVGVVLLIACANVANLFLVRAQGKEGEMAVRAAMGASTGRIGWEYLKESLLLGAMGGLGGLILAQVGLRSLVALAPANLPRLEEVSLDSTVLLFPLAVSVGSGVSFGLLPLMRHGRAQLVGALKEGGRSRTRDRSRHRALNLLAVFQMALALVLLVAGGLMLRSFQSLRGVDPGFRNPEEILALRLYLPPREMLDAADVATTYEMIVRRLEEVPGVSSVGLATAIPMDGSNNVNPFYVQGQTLDPDGPRISRRHKWIGEGYLESLRIPLLMGRSFTWEDIHNRAPVALLSESLAVEVFGSPELAMGQRIAARPDPPEWKEIVGIVTDVREDGLDQPPPKLVYWPQVTLAFWEGSSADQVQTWRSAGLAVRSRRVNTPGFLSEVEDAIWEVRPNLPLMRVRPLTDLMAASISRTSFTLILLGIAGGAALILGLVGVYGVISYAVSQRRQELGMRMALGAQAGDVKAMVLRQGFTLAAVGVVAGLALALGLTRLMSALLFGVSPADTMTYALVAAALLAVALLASYLPAQRAASVDPMTALRAE